MRRHWDMAATLFAVATFAVALASACADTRQRKPPPQPEATPVGEPEGVRVEGVVGPGGGSLSSSDAQVTIAIPPGALAADTALQVEAITNTAWGGRGNAFRLLPHGQVFQIPITIRMKYAAAEINGTSAEALRVAYQDDQGFWHRYNTVSLDTTAQELSVTTTHFSDWSRVHGAQIVPGSATVRANATLNLSVEFCQAVDEGDELVSLLARCEIVSDDDVLTASDWSVNGVAGGNAQVGTVSGGGTSATFTAPPSAPSSNPVAVSASINALPPSRIMLTSNLLITGGKTWGGQVSSERHSLQPGGVTVVETVNTQVTFVEDPAFPGSGTFTLTDGTFSGRFTLTSPSYGGCTTQGTKAGPLRGGPGGIPAGSLTISDFPGTGIPAQFLLMVTVIDAYDGTSDCNDMHNVEQLMSFQPVAGPAVPLTPFQSGATEINETVTVPDAAGGTMTVRIGLRQL